MSDNPIRIRAELHCHSNLTKQKWFHLPFSHDSIQSVEEILDACLKRNISILAITDHDSMTGYRKAKKIIEEKHLNILLIPGMEITSKDGHILAYGIKNEVPSRLSALETINLIHQQKGLAVAAHPFMFFAIGKKIFNLPFDALEVQNPAVFNFANQRAKSANDKLKLPGLAGSDAHTHRDIGKAQVKFTEPIGSFDAFRKAVLNKQFTIDFSPIHLSTMMVRHIIEDYKRQLFRQKITIELELQDGEVLTEIKGDKLISEAD